MFSKRTRYALRLLIHMDLNEKRGFRTVEELSRQTDIPTPYLGKIVGALAEMGYLETKKGPTGGARLAVDSNQILIDDVLRSLGEFTPLETREETSVPSDGFATTDQRFMNHCITLFREEVLDSMTLRQAVDIMEEKENGDPNTVDLSRGA